MVIPIKEEPELMAQNIWQYFLRQQLRDYLLGIDTYNSFYDNEKY